MLICNYEVVQLDGDYAHLRQTGSDIADLKPVARALLPKDIQEGSLPHYELLKERF